MKLLTTIIILSHLLITGCAGLPSEKHIKKDLSDYQLPKLPTAGKAMVYIVRPSNLGSLLHFNVFLDNKEPSSEIGYTLGEQYIYFSIEPGEYKILSNAGNWAEINIIAQQDEVIFIKQTATPGVIFAWNFLSRLTKHEGMYFVKQLKIGKIIKQKL